MRFFVALLLWAPLAGAELKSFKKAGDLAPGEVKSGSDFLTRETREFQADEFANPGYLWVQEGRAAFFRAAPGTPACSSCHTVESMSGLAARYPRFDPQLKRLINLSGKIAFGHDQKRAPPLHEESAELLALTAFITSLSRGRPYAVQTDGPAARYFRQGRKHFFRRRGQLNLACSQCHDNNWGRLLRGDTISQGHITAWPGYRFEWQTFGSLHRRFQDCDTGIRAEPYALGSEEYTSLELYLAWRAADLPIESPGVRR